jgi:multiple sugar transport system substrate-binding protein
MIRHRLLLAILVTVVAAVSSPTAAARVELILGTHFGPSKHGDLLADYIADYNAIQSDVLVSHHMSRGWEGSYNEQFLVQAAAGAGPDIVHTPTGSLRTYTSMKLLSPPSPQVTEQLKSKLLPGARTLASLDGIFYGPPTENQMRALLLNGYLFEQLGLSREAPKTWDGLASLARKIRRISADGQVEIAGLLYDGRHAPYRSLGWSNGADLVDPAGLQATINTSAWRETFQFLRDLAADQTLIVRGFSEFAVKDQAGMMLAPGPWVRSNFINRRGADWFELVSTAPLPPGRTGRPVAEQYGYVFAVTTQCKYQLEAWRFLTWLTADRSREGTTRMGNVMAVLGSVPVTEDDVRYQPLMKEPFFQGFYHIVADGYTKTGSHLPPISIPMNEEMEPAILGQSSVESALERLQYRTQALLDEYNAKRK